MLRRDVMLAMLVGVQTIVVCVIIVVVWRGQCERVDGACQEICV